MVHKYKQKYDDISAPEMHSTKPKWISTDWHDPLDIPPNCLPLHPPCLPLAISVALLILNFVVHLAVECLSSFYLRISMQSHLTFHFIIKQI